MSRFVDPEKSRRKLFTKLMNRGCTWQDTTLFYEIRMWKIDPDEGWDNHKTLLIWHNTKHKPFVTKGNSKPPWYTI